MIVPKVIRTIRPHAHLGDRILVSKGNMVMEISLAEKVRSIVPVGAYMPRLFIRMASKWNLSKRILRLGFHDLLQYRQGHLGIQNKAIVWRAPDSRHFREVFATFRGSRPLRLLKNPTNDYVYFGEYFGNPDRDEVYIYGSENAVDWHKVWTFGAGSVRHVHGLEWDPYRKGIWILTGDSDAESSLWFTDDNFETVENVISGTQKARAVEVIPTQDGLIVPMDSPLEKNYIHLFNISTKEFQPVAALPGSAFHATYSSGLYLISTVTEPSKVNNVDYASVWASLDGVRWREISRFERDWIPVRYQNIGRYSEIYFPRGENSGEYIVGYGQAIKGLSDCMLLWEKQGIVEYLKE